MFEIEPLTPRFGAVVHGIDVGGSFDSSQADELRKAFTDHKVLFFRDQDITLDQHVAFAQIFGTLAPHGTYGPGLEDVHRSDRPEVMRLVHDRDLGRGTDNEWHSDSMYWPHPPLGAIARALVVPEVGGDTLWADMSAVWEGLSPDVQRFIEPLRAVHDATLGVRSTAVGHLDEIRAAMPPVEHPLVRTHPVSGLKSVYAAEYQTSHIVGLSPAESADILRFLYRQTTIPEFQVRWRWQANSMALWDNRILQHYAVFDYTPHKRVLERVLLVEEEG